MATTGHGDDRRSSGIALVGELPWGSHFWPLYTTQRGEKRR